MIKKIIISSTFALVLVSILSAQAPSSIANKKLAIIGSVTELSLSINNQYYFTSMVNQVGRYNVGLSNEDWSLERYHYRKTGEQTADLTITNYDGDQARLQLSFNSPTSGSVSGSYHSVSNELQWSTLDATWTVEDLDLTVIPDTELPPDPSGYYAPVSIGGGTLSAQDKYWPVYDETISFDIDGSFSANITNGSDDPTGTGSYSYSKTGTNSATLSYSIDGAGYTFEYALQFTGENTGIYSKFADYGGGSTDITTGPFSLSGIAVPEQYAWEDYDDFSGSSLDSSKWGTMYFYGGDKPVISSGQVKFSSSGKSNSASSEFKHGWDSSAFIDYTEEAPGSVLYVKDESIYGIEALITLPSGSPAKTAICLQVGSLNPYGQHIAELMNDTGNGPSFWIHDYVADTGISTESSNENTYKVSVINDNQKNIFYVNDTKVHELDASNFTPDWFGINTFENNGQAYNVYADNVRVLRRTLEVSDLAVRPLSIRASRDLVYLQTPSGPNEIEGAGEIAFELELFDQPNITSLSLTIDGQNYSLSSDQKPNGFSLEYGYKDQSKPKELFDLESASDSDWSSYKSGKNFEFSLTIGENYYNYTHILPGEAELPTPPSPSISGGGLWKIDKAGYDYLEVDVAGSYIISWAEFDTTDQNDFIQVSLVELVEGDEQSIFEKIILSPTATSYEIAGDLLDLDKQYIIYIEFLNVVQSENPDGFVHATGSDVSQSLLLTSAKSFSALSFILIDPVIETVVSGLDGRPVVMRMGDEYQWNSTLDGVKLWGVWEDDEDGWISATLKYENGMQKGSIGLTDELGTNLEVNHPYIIDENGMIKVTEDTAFQYDQVITVENGVITTADDSSFPLSDTSKFFITRTAAEEYYYSKANPKNWMWFDLYPWVYSHEEQDWLYFHPSGGTLMYWSYKGNAWRKFNN